MNEEYTIDYKAFLEAEPAARLFEGLNWQPSGVELVQGFSIESKINGLSVEYTETDSIGLKSFVLKLSRNRSIHLSSVVLPCGKTGIACVYYTGSTKRDRHPLTAKKARIVIEHALTNTLLSSLFVNAHDVVSNASERGISYEDLGDNCKRYYVPGITLDNYAYCLRHNERLPDMFDTYFDIEIDEHGNAEFA